MSEPVAIAILAKAPVPGLAKTRLIPKLGAEGAAALQARFIGATVAKALEAQTGPVRLWCAPDTAHPMFAELARLYPIALHAQPEADLGQRMLRAVEAEPGPVLVIGTDCPPIDAGMLRDAAAILSADGPDGAEAVMAPALDGGYGLIGMRRPQPAVFAGMVWSVPSVADDTRRRARQAGLTLRELPAIWDVDEPEDLVRLAEWEAVRA